MSCPSFCSKDEVFNHLDSSEIEKVKEQVQGKREWYNTQMQACQTLVKSVDPPVTCTQIRAELKVSCVFIHDCYHYTTVQLK